jgi:hypothetical protein
MKNNEESIINIESKKYKILLIILFYNHQYSKLYHGIIKSNNFCDLKIQLHRRLAIFYSIIKYKRNFIKNNNFREFLKNYQNI